MHPSQIERLGSQRQQMRLFPQHRHTDGLRAPAPARLKKTRREGY